MNATLSVKQVYFALVFCAMFGFHQRIQAAEPQGKSQPSTTAKTDIIGGREVRFSESPWQVALVSSGGSHVDTLFCGGTLIDSRWVLTAAHCFYEPVTCKKIPKQAIFIAFGSTDLGESVSLRAPKKLHPHANHKCGVKSFDIALIELEKSVDVGTFVQLPNATSTRTSIKSGMRLMTTGWGLTTVDGRKTRYLMEVDIPVVEDKRCEDAYPKDWPKTNICAGEADKDSCTGDSGGPLYRRLGTDNALQVGIVSFGNSCGKAKYPGAYTAVAEHLSWIEDIRKSKPCTPKDVLANIC